MVCLVLVFFLFLSGKTLTKSAIEENTPFLLWHCCVMLGGISSSRQFSAMLFKNKSNRKANKSFPQNEKVGLRST